jgi:hypothetical protein
MEQSEKQLQGRYMAKPHELDEWHCRVEDLIGTAYPSFMYLSNVDVEARGK